MAIVVDGADRAKWTFTPDRDVLEVALELPDRRYVAYISADDMPAVGRVLAELNHPAPGEKIDVSSHFIRILGRDPFVEHPVDRRPWYRKLLRSKS
ncbi:hypothetical protein GCM10010172_72930 [Paractinoplanes ferrugineus]|uniref:Uncharacterized protein n=1 Tax=Paractinoplanes ferrugineus TaxID=113564 RepID=A0A919MKU6_9ACTN|nr:hypothetical protein [Actinoplanes ferrugineus]GIE11552.1 hypothetical protein Afe05nite_33920 [Actinoplanes ferrugineus]